MVAIGIKTFLGLTVLNHNFFFHVCVCYLVLLLCIVPLHYLCCSLVLFFCTINFIVNLSCS